MFKTIEGDRRLAQSLRAYVLLLPGADLTGWAHTFFYEMAEALLDEVDLEVENAIIEMLKVEADWAMAGNGRFLTLSDVMPVLTRLAELKRWEALLSATREIARARASYVGSLNTLTDLLMRAPPEYDSKIRMLHIGS